MDNRSTPENGEIKKKSNLEDFVLDLGGEQSDSEKILLDFTKQGTRPAQGTPTPSTPTSGTRPAQGTPAPSTPASGTRPAQGTPAPSTPTPGTRPAQGTPARNAPTREIPEQLPLDDSTRVIAIPDDAAPSADSGDSKTVELPGGALPKSDPAAATASGTKAVKKTRSKRNSDYTEANNSVMSLIKCMAYITVVFAIAAIISVSVIFAANDIFAFVKSEDTMEVEVPEGADFGDIADILHDNGIINYKSLFKLYMGGKVKDIEFEPGTYTLTPMTSYSDLIYILRVKAPTGISYITIPEGYTTDEIIDLMVSKGIGTKEGYIDVINNYDFDYWFIDELGEDWAADGRFYRLDGYLFPDSYEFYNASSEVTVINKFLARFDTVFTKNYRTSAAELGYTVDEILTLASMIEKEGGARSEFGLVSSVFHNRLKSPNFQYMESDATIVYAIQHATGSRPSLTGEDLEYDSPYNSYKNPGLSPGPIANPSNSAILAALNPTQSNYYFFISDGAQTYFSSTKAEHDAYKAQIQARVQG